jgi:DNA-binding protein Fis
VTTVPPVLIDPDPERRAHLARLLQDAGHVPTLAADVSGAYLESLAGEETRASGRRGRPSLAELDRRYAGEILRQTGGNKTRAAEILGIDRKTLYRLIGEHRQPAAVAAPPPATDRHAGA